MWYIKAGMGWQEVTQMMMQQHLCGWKSWTLNGCIPTLKYCTSNLVTVHWTIRRDIASKDTLSRFDCHLSQGWGQFRNWNWNWHQFQFQFQELELQRNWIKGIGIGIGIDKKELKELIQFLFLIVNSFWFLPEASFGLRVLSLPVSVCVCVCVSITCLSGR